jgi:hypothetical protein
VEREADQRRILPRLLVPEALLGEGQRIADVLAGGGCEGKRLPGISASYSKLAFDAVHELVRRHAHDVAARKGRTTLREALARMVKPFVVELVALPQCLDSRGQHVIDGAKAARLDLRGSKAWASGDGDERLEAGKARSEGRIRRVALGSR